MEDLISKKQMRTILSSLKDYIDTKNLVNVTSLDETLLYTGTDKTSTNKSYTINETLTQNSYDYLIVQLSGFRSGEEFSTSGTFIMAWESNRSVPSWYGSYSFEESNSNTMNGVILIDVNTLYFYPSSSSTVSFQCINKIIGIKKKSLSTADIAEMAMPSSVYITIPTNVDWTAIANGEVRFRLTKPDNSVSAPILRINNDVVYDYAFTGSAGYTVAFSKIVRKGDIVKLFTTDTVAFSRFYYSVGDAKALGLI